MGEVHVRRYACRPRKAIKVQLARTDEVHVRRYGCRPRKAIKVQLSRAGEVHVRRYGCGPRKALQRNLPGQVNQVKCTYEVQTSFVSALSCVSKIAWSDRLKHRKALRQFLQSIVPRPHP